ncbi:helix-turn-helix domain-containing protein [Leuconostoc lactis]|uniref:helix-turn-helix domain-containing protein n=1 Tax=Leuconostoc lactis TaxID=1246 RepID=UPI00020D9DDB|nr:helix-turn-helix transcriptional regulator [Leuconostoc lactis]
MSLFERTKEVAKKRGINLQNTAESAGLSANAIYRWKTTNPSKVAIEAVAKVLNVSTDYLLGFTDDPKREVTSIPKTLDLNDVLDDEIILAFDGHNIPDEDKAKIKEYIQLLDLKRRSEHE